MTERIPTPPAAKRIVYTGEELRRKRNGTWDPATMVSATSPEGAPSQSDKGLWTIQLLARRRPFGMRLFIDKV